MVGWHMPQGTMAVHCLTNLSRLAFSCTPGFVGSAVQEHSRALNLIATTVSVLQAKSHGFGSGGAAAAASATSGGEFGSDVASATASAVSSNFGGGAAAAAASSSGRKMLTEPIA